MGAGPAAITAIASTAGAAGSILGEKRSRRAANQGIGELRNLLKSLQINDLIKALQEGGEGFLSDPTLGRLGQTAATQSIRQLSTNLPKIISRNIAAALSAADKTIAGQSGGIARDLASRGLIGSDAGSTSLATLIGTTRGSAIQDAIANSVAEQLKRFELGLGGLEGLLKGRLGFAGLLTDLTSTLGGAALTGRTRLRQSEVESGSQSSDFITSLLANMPKGS